MLPELFQDRHPPLRVAATTKETFPQVGALGYPIFIGLRGLDRPDLIGLLDDYRKAWKDALHPGNGDVYIRIPVFLGKTQQEAYDQAEESTMRSYRRLAQNFSLSAVSAGTVASEERVVRGERLSTVT